MDRDEEGKIICPYNMMCHCDEPKCHSCGWYPPVAEARKKEIMKVKLYRVPFTGYCEVWAKSPEEAADNAENTKQQFFAHYDYGDPVCLEQEDENELD